MASAGIYKVALKHNKGSVIEITTGVYALLDCNEHGLIKHPHNSRYVIVQRTTEEEYKCSCKTNNCIHIRYVYNFSNFDFQNEETDIFKSSIKVRQIEQTSLFGVFSESSNSFGIIKKTDKTLRCRVCFENVSSCVHKKSFMKHSSPVDQSTNAANPEIFDSISKDTIPYPLTFSDKDIYKAYLNGTPYPKHLVPEYNALNKCQCGYLFSNEDPIASQWIQEKNAKIHLKDMSLKCIVYYRPTIGNCSCYQGYDGRSDLLVNLNNKHLYSYSWMFEIFHTGHETGYPLRAAFRSAQHTREICIGENINEYFYKKLRLGFNAFIRLLDLGYPSNFKCDQCEDEGIDIVIIDGISMGCPKDKMESNIEPPAPVNACIDEVGVKDRVFVHGEKTRKLLATYSGLTKNGVLGKPKRISDGEYTKLKGELSGYPSLKILIEKAGNPCPRSLQKILGELSHGSPTCGIIQITADCTFEAERAIKHMANGDFTQSHSESLRKYAPMLVDFIFSEDIPQQCISNVLKDLLSSVYAPFRMPLPQPSLYGARANAADMKLRYFPNHPPCRGKTRYAADKNSEKPSGCKKEPVNHINMSPGIFTAVCPHGTTLGLELMDSPESPRTPFNLLMCHFDEMPGLIIYDNACHLHLYALKREPTRFKNTRFMVDRLHYKNHKKCSEGYCMDSYDPDELIKNCNSQSNEQVNSLLRRLKAPVSGMTSDNAKHHVSVFLALRNIDINVKYNTE